MCNKNDQVFHARSKYFGKTGFETKTGKHYKVDLPSDLYNKMKTQADLCGFSMSKLMRIGINDTLYLFIDSSLSQPATFITKDISENAVFDILFRSSDSIFQ